MTSTPTSTPEPTSEPPAKGSDDVAVTAADADRPEPLLAPLRGVVGAVPVAIAVAVVALLVATAYLALRGDESAGETRDLAAQGDSETVQHEDAVSLTRRDDGLFAEVDIPTPAPSTYEYPTSDLVPPGSDPHPQVTPGASDAPEVFTLWVFAFNVPGACTDGECDTDDLGPDAPAQGGVFQVDGRIADGDRLHLLGGVRLGAMATNGVVLADPTGAEVHVAIAPHGRSLSGEDAWRQLNEPVGTPEFWWAAAFRP